MQYIYNKEYRTSWQQFTYECSNLLYKGWCVGDAWYIKDLAATQLQQTNEYSAYVCNWTGASWKCGCKDSSCTTQYWNLQESRKE